MALIIGFELLVFSTYIDNQGQITIDIFRNKLI